MILGGSMHRGKRVQPVHQALGVNPAQGVAADIEL
jgi:hypothetical protein